MQLLPHRSDEIGPTADRVASLVADRQAYWEDSLRTRVLALFLFGVLVLLGGCAEVERVATGQEVELNSEGELTYQVAWRSELYGPQVADYPYPDPEFELACYSEVVVGEAVPTACLTGGALRDETDAFSRNAWLAWGLVAVAITGLVFFALRRVAWAPEVEPGTGHLSSGEAAGTPGSAVELMRSVESEKGLRVEARAVGHDLAHPAWTGVAMGVVILSLLTLLVGFGTALSWGIVAGMLLFVGAGVTALLLQLGLLTRWSDAEPAARRLFFLGGVTAALLLVPLNGLALQAPLQRLNGVDWPI